MNLTQTIKRYWDQDPVAVILAGAAAVTATAKLLDAMSAAQGRRAYSRQVDNSIRRQK